MIVCRTPLLSLLKVAEPEQPAAVKVVIIVRTRLGATAVTTIEAVFVVFPEQTPQFVVGVTGNIVLSITALRSD